MTATTAKSSKLHLASGLELPEQAVTQTFAILGKRGSGKTNTAVVMAEEMLTKLYQVVIVDPLDVWWGLRSTRDGKHAGFAVTILGGDHADLPLESTAGQVVADFVVESGASIILSLRHFSNNEQRRFVTDFCERLFHRKGPQERRQPLHLILDEADEFAPQKIMAGQERMFGAIDRIVRRGRVSGLGVTLISQRAAVVNKDVLTQAEVLICHQTISPQDRKALDAWVEAHDAHNQRGAFMESLASLAVGEAWVWSPGWLNLFKRVKVDQRDTFDSSATPEIGQLQARPRALAPVDLQHLEQRMAATIERAKADDPKELRRQIAELKKQLLKNGAGDPAAIEKARSEGFREGSREAERVLIPVITQARAAIERARGALEFIPEVPAEYTAVTAAVSSSSRAQRLERIPKATPSARRNTPASAAQSDIPIGERAILTACAQHYDSGCSREQLTVLCGYKRSSRDAYIQRLVQKAFLNLGPGGAVICTEDGRNALGPDFEPLPTGEELVNWWRQRLPEGERRILDILIASGGQTVTRDTLEQETGYKRSSRDAYLQRLAARKLIETVGPGTVRASKELCG